MSAAIAAAAAVASAVVGAAGSIEGGYAKSASAGYNAKIAAQNAQLATQNANLEGAIGNAQAGQAGLKTQEQAGAIKTAQAANNVDVNSGSATGVQKSAAEMGMMNEMNIRSNAARQAYGFQVSSQSEADQSHLDRMAQNQDVTAGYIGGATSLLGGASQAAGDLKSGGNGSSGNGSSGNGSSGNGNWGDWFNSKGMGTAPDTMGPFQAGG